jgi:hypothetical protein
MREGEGEGMQESKRRIVDTLLCGTGARSLRHYNASFCAGLGERFCVLLCDHIFRTVLPLQDCGCLTCFIYVVELMQGTLGQILSTAPPIAKKKNILRAGRQKKHVIHQLSFLRADL